MRKKITVLRGDGIGPEIVDQAVKTIRAIGESFGHEFELTDALIGASAIDATGNPFPDQTLEKCTEADAILLGAIGDPKYDNDPKAKVRPEQGLLKMRKSLGLFTNIRPIKAFGSLIDKSPLKRAIIENVDFVVYRELTGGIYFGEKGRNKAGDEAFDNCNYSRDEIERVTRIAFEAASKRRKRLTLVDKANVLETSRLWREIVQEISKDYANIDVSYLFVDNAAMQIILNPSQFDVILTENMFGDIISDEASVITGSIGLLPSASIGQKAALFEPIHGSYPQAAGKNIANPMATILSVAMMFDYFEMEEETNAIKKAVEIAIKSGNVTVDLNAGKFISCSGVGDYIAGQIRENIRTMATT